MHIGEQLRELFEKHNESLPELAWASEADRWAELVYCLLNQCKKVDPGNTRQAVDVLASLGLLQVTVLAKLGGSELALFRRVLKVHGFSAEQTRKGTAVLRSVAATVTRRYSGKIQCLLRKQGERLRNELSLAFRRSGLLRGEVEYAVSHWLQNALSLPISLESAAVLKFCNANKITILKLLQEADKVDVNVALVDDLLEMAAIEEHDDIASTRKA